MNQWRQAPLFLLGPRIEMRFKTMCDRASWVGVLPATFSFIQGQSHFCRDSSSTPRTREIRVWKSQDRVFFASQRSGSFGAEELLGYFFRRCGILGWNFLFLGMSRERRSRNFGSGVSGERGGGSKLELRKIFNTWRSGFGLYDTIRR